MAFEIIKLTDLLTYVVTCIHIAEKGTFFVPSVWILTLWLWPLNLTEASVPKDTCVSSTIIVRTHTRRTHCSTWTSKMVVKCPTSLHS